MPTIVAAAESQVMLDGKPLDAVRSIEYRAQQTHTPIFALGSTERIGVVSGPQLIEGRVRIASTNPVLAGKGPDDAFQLSAQLKHGKTTVTVTFDECYLSERGFSLAVGEFGEAVYAFTATRVREE